MQNKSSLKKLINPLSKGMAFGFGFILIVGIAFAFTTWAPGQVPQANPANGNVELSICPNCPTGYHVDTTTNNCVANPVTSRINCQAWYDAGSTADGVYSIDPDGNGALAAQQVYCKMNGKWALVVGVNAANRNHINSAAVNPANLTSVNGKGKFSDAFINALKVAGRNQMALEAIPGWAHCGSANPPEGFSSCYTAWQFDNCNFVADQPMINAGANYYPNCQKGNNNSWWANTGGFGMGYNYDNNWGGLYGALGSNGLHEEWVDNQYRAYNGRLWVR